MDTKNIIKTVAIILTCSLFLISFLNALNTIRSIEKLINSLKESSERNLGSSLDNRSFSSMSTTSQITVNTSSSRISASSSRAFALYSNYGPNDMYLCFNTDKVCTAGTASVLLASTTGRIYQMNLGVNEYVGSITAVSIGGASLLNITEVR